MSRGSTISSAANTKEHHDLAFGDLHLNENPRDAYRHEFMKALPNLISKLGPDRLIILGDLTDEKDRHSAWLVNTLVDYFCVLLQKVREIIVLRGNHDYIDEDNPFFAFLRRIERVRFISHPCYLFGDLFLPHTLDYKTEWQRITRHVPVAYSHNTFAGAIGDSGHALSGGIPPTDVPVDIIVSGDIHYPQVTDKVHYAGAPYRIDFGDNFEPRILRRRGNRITSIGVGHLAPQKRLLELVSPDDREVRGAQRGDIVKIRVALRYKDVANWADIRQHIAAWAEEEGWVYSISPQVHYQPGARTTTATNISDEDLLRQYAKVKGLDKDTLQTGLELL